MPLIDNGQFHESYQRSQYIIKIVTAVTDPNKLGIIQLIVATQVHISRSTIVDKFDFICKALHSNYCKCIINQLK